jgi:hypothetical protein
MCEHSLDVLVAKTNTNTNLPVNQLGLVSLETGAHVIKGEPLLELVASNEPEDLGPSRQRRPPVICCVFCFERRAAYSRSQ